MADAQSTSVAKSVGEQSLKLQTVNSTLAPMSEGKRRQTKSDTRRILNPTDILGELPHKDLNTSWEWFNKKLKIAGFDSCGFLISNSDAASPLSHEDSRLFGEVVSKDYLDTVRNNPKLQSQARPYRRLRTSRTPVTFMNDEDLKDSTPSEIKLARQINTEFNIQAWALFPVHMPDKDRIFTLGWWDLDNQDDANHLWKAEAETFTLAATYFCESISALAELETGKNGPKLSQREMECLLWAGAGKTTSEIATILSVADGTVEEYFKRSAKKLGATTRAQACVRAILSGLITP